VGGHTRKVTTFATTGGPQIKGWAGAIHKNLKLQDKASALGDEEIVSVW
jgi:hypothetical protein